MNGALMPETTLPPAVRQDAEALDDFIADLIERGYPPESEKVIGSVLEAALGFGGDGEEIVAELCERLPGWAGATILAAIVERAAIDALRAGFIGDPYEQ